MFYKQKSPRYRNHFHLLAHYCMLRFLSFLLSSSRPSLALFFVHPAIWSLRWLISPECNVSSRVVGSGALLRYRSQCLVSQRARRDLGCLYNLGFNDGPLPVSSGRWAVESEAGKHARRFGM